MAEVENYVLREGFDIDEEISDIAETVSKDTDMSFPAQPQQSYRKDNFRRKCETAAEKM